MASSAHFTTHYVTIGLMLVVLFSAISLPGHGITPPSATAHHDSLLLTVNPDKSVGVGINATTSFPIPQNVSSLFPAGYSIHSSSNFSQQANAVVQTSVIQYQLPSQLSSLVESISLTATKTSLSNEGSLTIDTTTGVPIQSVNISYSASLTQIGINATAQIQFNPFFVGTPLNFASSQTAFLTTWNSTFGNATWTKNTVSQIENATSQALTVTVFYGNETDNSNSANISIRFVAVPSSSTADFAIAIEDLLSTTGIPSTGLDTVVRSVLNLETSETTNLTYTSATGNLVIQSTTNYVSNLDAKLNSLKNQYFQMVFLPFKLTGISIPARLLFLNSTLISVSKISTISNLDLSTGTSSMTLNGLVINPPTVGTNTNFTIPGLFQTMGTIPAPGIDLTLVGGSNATYQVKVVVPADTPAPSSTTANSATWTNLQDAATLSDVQFQLQRLPASFLNLLTSPTGIAIEVVAAAAIVAGVFLLARRKRARIAASLAPSAPTPMSGSGLSPAPLAR